MGQMLQIEAPLSENLPAAHLGQLEAPASEYVPGSQSTQVPPMRYLPAVHV